MFENGREIKIGKKTYLALFNTVALKLLIGKYGGLEEMSKKLESDTVMAIGEYSWLLALLIGQGTALNNFENGLKDVPPTVEQIELSLKPRELIALQPIIFATIQDGMSSGEPAGEATEEVDEVLEEVLAEKNEEAVAK